MKNNSHVSISEVSLGTILMDRSKTCAHKAPKMMAGTVANMLFAFLPGMLAGTVAIMFFAFWQEC